MAGDTGPIDRPIELDILDPDPGGSRTPGPQEVLADSPRDTDRQVRTLARRLQRIFSDAH